MTNLESEPRRCGVLLHPTSLPSGNFSDAYRWLEFMASCGLSVWQVLPLEPPQNGLSPYQCNSAFAINPALLSKSEALSSDNLGYKNFCREQRHWLDDYAMFVVLKQKFNDLPWFEWPESYRKRNSYVLETIANANDHELAQIKWEQFLLYREWQSIHAAAKEKNILLLGDIPIFVAHDSADVWANQSIFKLDEYGKLTVVTGVPPDYFSEVGQRWGNPHYDWKVMEAQNFDWWVNRMQHHADLFDLVRIDHFRGLAAVWEIDAECETAIEGRWVESPGETLLNTIKNQLHELPLIAEDLGLITAEVTALKNQFHLPGMAVLQFSFDHFEDNPHKPLNITPNTVCYTGTHDNNTTLGWYKALDEDFQHHVRAVLEIDQQADIVDGMITTALNSEANLVVIPLQDFLKLDASARMNTPGTIDHNWQWSYKNSQLEQPELTESIKQQLINSGRYIHE